MQGTDSGGYDGSGSQHGYGGQNDYTHKQKSSHGGMLLGAAGGLAAGALLSNALNGTPLQSSCIFAITD
jgi:hypothetical protein